MSWPPRWDRPHFKQPTLKAERRRRSRARKQGEVSNKTRVRARDGRCRFPLCRCREKGLALHVAHLRHKGAGGNPKGDRSEPQRMILVCAPRHRESRLAIDQGTIRVQPRTRRGTNGPVEWWIDLAVLPRHTTIGDVPIWRLLEGGAAWFCVAREASRGVTEPLDPDQREVLERIGSLSI